jgi:hypothetical protein
MRMPIENAGGGRVGYLRHLLGPGIVGPHHLEDGADCQRTHGEPARAVESQLNFGALPRPSPRGLCGANSSRASHALENARTRTYSLPHVDGHPASGPDARFQPCGFSRASPQQNPAIPPKADGTSTIGPVRAGEYAIAAVTGMSLAKLFEPSARAEVAARITKAGERIILVENEKHSIDLRITKLQ